MASLTPQLQLKLLGNPEVLLDGTAVSTDRRKAVALLAYLAVTRISHSRDYLAAFFWPDADQSRGLAYLRRTIWEINQMIGAGWLAVSRDEVILVRENPYWLDVAIWEEALEGKRETAWETAVTLYRDDFMAGFSLRDSEAFDNWQTQQVQTRRIELGHLLGRLIDANLTRQQWPHAERFAQRWLAVDPLQEQAHRALMTIWARTGQRAQALRQYDHCVQLLAEELGVPPELETEQLAAAIRAGEVAAASGPAAPPIPTAAPSHNLPAAPTPFVGREAELAAITAELRHGSVRLLTLLGPGGSGKTRLSLAVAQTVLPDFADGVWFVPLASLSASESIVHAMAKALSFRLFEEEQARQQLLNYLRGRALLLVLDNFEHLLEAGASELIGDILAQAPQVRVLVTSRMRLGLRGESLFAVDGMQVPVMETAVSWTHTDIATAEQTYSALQLFGQSARLVSSDFRLDDGNVADVIAICQLVEGMPLGIELAASWLALLTVAEVRAEVQKNMDFLATEMQDVPRRQRSIRAVFNYSWALLTAEEQRVFPALAIFHGGLTREAAEAVTGASLRTLMALVNKSLIRREENGRFAIHELLRQYAAEKMQADPDMWLTVRDQHCFYYLAWLKQLTAQMKGPRQKAAFDALEMDINNIRAAWLWAVVHRYFEEAITAMDGLFIFYLVRGSLEDLGGLLDVVLDDVGEQMAETAVTPHPQSDILHRFYAMLLSIQSMTASTRVVSPEAVHYSQKALDLMHQIGLSPGMALSYILASNIYAWRVNLEQGLAYSEKAMSLLRQQNDPWHLALIDYLVSGLLWRVRRREESLALLHEGIALSREIGDDVLLAYNLRMLSGLLSEAKAYEQALAHNHECRAIYERLQSPLGVAQVLVNMGTICDAAGWYRQGVNYYEDARQLFQQIGNPLAEAESLSWVSISQQRLGDFDRALQTREKSLALFQAVNDINGIAWSYFETAELYRLRDDLVQAAKYYEKSFATFTEHGMQIGLSFSYRGKGTVALLQGDLAAAKVLLDQSLDYGERTYDDWSLANTHFVRGLLFLAQSEPAQAAAAFRHAVRLGAQVANQGVVMQGFWGWALWAERTGNVAQALQLARLVRDEESTWAETRSGARKMLVRLAKGGVVETAVSTVTIAEMLPLLS